MSTLEVSDRAQWREWLQDNAATADEVWLVIHHKGSGIPCAQHAEAIEEALCFGWIDSLARRHDAGSWRQRFTPRSPKGVWSTVNRALVERLTADGLMTPAGQAAVDLAKRTGMWDLLAEAQAGVVPDDLRARLDADAARNLAAFPPSARRALLESIARARRPDTRERRVAHAADCAARNVRS